MEAITHYGQLHKLFDDNFIDYTSYVIKERAIPDIADGLKPVQRRILQTMFNMDDGRYNKVANVVGETMKLHPHGDASIFAALVNLANKGYLIDRQGNFGNIYTGDQASAARYIECRLSTMARETMFNKDITGYVDSYDGRLREPVSLPAKIPLLLMQGAEGIAVGMATRILPHNFCELLEAQKRILREEPFTVYPDFIQGGRVDVSGYNNGNGRIKCRARLESKDDKTILVKEIPYGTTTQSLIESIEKAVRAGKIKILSINDFTAEDVEIEIKLARGVYAGDTIKALYAFTDCEVSINANFTVISENRPIVSSVEKALRFNTRKLVDDLKRELEIELDRLNGKLHDHLLEQIFVEERIYKRIEECRSLKAVFATIDEALLPFHDRLIREVRREDIERLLEIRIKRISRYDINKKSKEIKEVRAAIKEVQINLRDLVGYSIRYLDALLQKYGHLYPRRTRIETFREVEMRAVALSNLTVGYDPLNGFLGYQVKGNQDAARRGLPSIALITCSEYDKLLLIFKDGAYRVINVVDKLFVGPDLYWAGILEEDMLFNVIYLDGRRGQSFVKRFRTPKFILDKEYRLFPEHKGSRIQFLESGCGHRVRVYYIPSRRAKSNYQDFQLDDFLVKGAAAIGKRISGRGVRRITVLAEKKCTPETEPQTLPGMEPDKK